MLFQWEIAPQDPKHIERNFWKSARAAESTRKFAEELFEGAVAQVKSSDELAAKFSQNWRLDRMSTIDRSILRLAIYEFKAGTAPVKVVFDEALELAKTFSTPEAGPFLNGLLDAVQKSLQGAK